MAKQAARVDLGHRRRRDRLLGHGRADSLRVPGIPVIIREQAVSARGIRWLPPHSPASSANALRTTHRAPYNRASVSRDQRRPEMHRRAFVRHGLLFGSAVPLLGRSGAGSAGEAGRLFQVIDAHGHAGHGEALAAPWSTYNDPEVIL